MCIEETKMNGACPKKNSVKEKEDSSPPAVIFRSEDSDQLG